MSEMQNIPTVIGALSLVLVVAAAMFLAACWSVARKNTTALTRDDVAWQELMAAVNDEHLHPATIAAGSAEAIEQEWLEMNQGGAA